MRIGSSSYISDGEFGPINITDSFVIPSNKFAAGRGSGEARLHIGHEESSLIRNFFGEKFFSGIKCFWLKSELIEYLDAAKPLYFSQNDQYRGGVELVAEWGARRASVLAEKNEEIFFEVYEQDKVAAAIQANRPVAAAMEDPRCYIKGDPKIVFELSRVISLPKATNLIIERFSTKSSEHLYKFKLVLDESYIDSSSVTSIAPPIDVVLDPDTSSQGPQDSDVDDEFAEREKLEQALIAELIDNKSLSATEVERLVMSRIGQGAFRDDLLESCDSTCPITKIMDKRILRASHIKPWRLASNEERLDPNNGLILAPTYDLLFDQGFITFEADKTLRISSELSEVTVRKLGLIDGSKFKDLPIGESHQAARLEYLKFHREVIFRK